MKHLLLASALLLVSPSNHALVTENSSISIDYIRGEGAVEGVKLALQYHTEYLRKFSDKLDLYFESSVNFWEYGSNNVHDTNFVLALSPVVSYPIGELNGHDVYAEFGIGLSLLDDTQFAGKDVSTHYQFEDRLGVKVKLGDEDENELSLRYFHYSNAGLKKPNPGLDFIAMSFMKRF
ncbi:MAG: acyloxyacyl hydrolase [Alteromonadaceae bacterium]|nr:acyloxyacyl hydrolase [Alteromonadaceae bacterium]